MHSGSFQLQRPPQLPVEAPLLAPGNLNEVTWRPIGQLLFPFHQPAASSCSLTMRLFSSFFSLLLLTAGAVASKKSATERFDEFHTKAQSNSPVKLNDASYKSLTSAPRDYSVAILLTALDARFGCQLCRDFQPEWDLVSKSWSKGDKSGESRMIFGTLDFTDGRDVFLSVRS